MATYPPQPWDLRGQLHASTFLVPLAEIPLDVPPGWRVVRVGRRAIVGAAWVSYEPSGVLGYRELMATVLVRRGWRVLPTVVLIWVDSDPSRAGGRELWGIPKELADFDFSGPAHAARDDKGPIARAVVAPRVRLPGRWPLSFAVVQRLHGEALVSPVGTRAGLSVGGVTLHAEPGGPLAFLAGRRALLSLTLRDFVMSFGRA